MAKKLFVGNVSWDVDDQQLNDAFAQYGAIDEAVIIKERQTGRSKGFGFVTFTNDDDADKAIEAMNGTELDGRPLTVNEARPMEPRD